MEEPIAEEVAETVEVAGSAVEPTPVEAAEEAAAEHEEQSAPWRKHLLPRSGRKIGYPRGW